MDRWTLYILECSDRSLYTGITTDLEKRIQRHNQGKATKYTRTRIPVKLVYNKSLYCQRVDERCPEPYVYYPAIEVAPDNTEYY